MCATRAAVSSRISPRRNPKHREQLLGAAPAHARARHVVVLIDRRDPLPRRHGPRRELLRDRIEPLGPAVRVDEDRPLGEHGG